MTDETVIAPAPKKKPVKRRVKKKAAPKRAPAAPKAAEPAAPTEYAGMTNTECATGCNRDGCVVSHKPYCAHPCKGGLQAGDMGNTAALQRLKAAQKLLGIEAVGKKFD